MQITVEISERAAAALSRMPFPSELVGASVAERLAWLAEEMADSVESEEGRAKVFAMYRQFGLKHPHDDSDDIDL